MQGPIRGSTTGRPVMALLDPLGRRWALRILWELRDGEIPTFRALQARCGDMSSSVLSRRVAELRESGIVAPDGFALTDEGLALLAALAPLDEWAKRWRGRSCQDGDGR